jgi:hypothetical protein
LVALPPHLLSGIVIEWNRIGDYSVLSFL